MKSTLITAGLVGVLASGCVPKPGATTNLAKRGLVKETIDAMYLATVVDESTDGGDCQGITHYCPVVDYNCVQLPAQGRTSPFADKLCIERNVKFCEDYLPLCNE